MSLPIKCIYCKKSYPTKPHIAHIFPEGLVGKTDFVLAKGEVCSSCNHDTSILDKYLLNELGLINFYTGSGITKKGKPKRINQRGIVGVRDPNYPWLYINKSSVPKTTRDGSIVSPDKCQSLAVSTPVFKNDGTVSFSLRINIRTNKRFCRAITKIAFEGACFYFGHELCLEDRFDPIRSYILHGPSSRRFIMPKEQIIIPRNEPWIHIKVGNNAQTGDIFAYIQVGLSILVDLSRTNSLIDIIYNNLPPDGKSKYFIFSDSHLNNIR